MPLKRISILAVHCKKVGNKDKNNNTGRSKLLIKARRERRR